MSANALWPIGNCAKRILRASGNIPYRFPSKKLFWTEKSLKIQFSVIPLTDHWPQAKFIWILLTISPSSDPKSKYSSRFPSSAELFSRSNGYVQTIFAGGPWPASNNENPRSKWTISWHGRFYCEMNGVKVHQHYQISIRRCTQTTSPHPPVAWHYEILLTWKTHRNENSRW